ncbi:MAG: glycosyltransferase [Candidatus Saccharimonadales bacterium]
MKLLDISVIIPFKDKAKMTSLAVTTFLQYGPPVKEFLMVSNNSSPHELSELKERLSGIGNVRIVEYNQPFNYQKMNNWAVKQSLGDSILFLNNDTEFADESAGVLEKMYAKALDPKVGMVGCLLLYGDRKTIQHAGVYIRPGLLGDHMYVGQSYKNALSQAGSEKYPYDVSESRPMSAVTGAVQVIERKKFEAVGGFDERFIICGGDVDLCLRLNKSGYQTWYAGGGYIVHKESQSRAYKPVPYIDFYYSYLSYIKGYDLTLGDPFLPKITEVMNK